MSLKRRAPKRFVVLVLDLLVTAAVISAAMAALLSAFPPAIFKARFIEVLAAMSNERATLIERHAHTGAWTGAAAGEGPQRQSESSRASYRIGTAEGRVVAAGILSGRPFTAALRPADTPWSIRWPCGADLPENLAPSVCRERTGLQTFHE
ncbi:MAG TPA: pilin [Burkholderiales bacterium]